MVQRFETERDRQAEREMSLWLSDAWGCKCIKQHGEFCRVDWHFYRGSKLFLIGELKRRYNGSSKYPTVFLAKRKHDALRYMSCLLSVPAFYIVKFDDSLRWIDIRNTDASCLRMAGRAPRPGSVHDIEPIIDVPIRLMAQVNRKPPTP